VAVKKFATSNLCKLKFYYTGPQLLNIEFYQPGYDFVTLVPGFYRLNSNINVL
jgi:hypothetical protein